MKKAIALFAVAGLAGVAQAGDIETRFLVFDSTGADVTANADDLEAGDYTIVLQAQGPAPLGFAAVRGTVDNVDGAATAGGTINFGSGAYNVGDAFSAATLSTVSLDSNTGGSGPQNDGPGVNFFPNAALYPPAFGAGAWTDILTFDVAFDGTSATFAYDPTSTPQNTPAGLLITDWSQQPGPPILVNPFANGSDFALWSPTTVTGGSNASSITLAPAPGALALIGLGGLVAGRRRR